MNMAVGEGGLRQHRGLWLLQLQMLADDSQCPFGFEQPPKCNTTEKVSSVTPVSGTVQVEPSPALLQLHPRLQIYRCKVVTKAFVFVLLNSKTPVASIFYSNLQYGKAYLD